MSNTFWNGVASVLGSMSSFTLFPKKTVMKIKSHQSGIAEDFDGLQKDADAIRGDWEKIIDKF